MDPTSAVFVGDGSLLIRCAEAYLRAGHTVACVATGNADIARWALANAIPLADTHGPFPLAMPEVEFEYLFSVANLRVLQADLIGRARRMAINFHDGPLPRYAGLHATSWALLARETSHGITWHEMTPAVDAGRIVRQVSFPIAPGETALSLNARCYEAGLAAFVSIVDDIGRGGLALSAPSGVRSYFAGSRRPDALATLDFWRPAEEIAALVRGLDFGPYPNPLARPKVYLGEDILLVGSARVAETASYATPGTVLEAEEGTVCVATASNDVVLGNCCDLLGRATMAGLAPGMVLPRLEATLRERLAARIPQAAKSEPSWSAAFNAFATVEVPYPRRKGNAARAEPRAPLRMRLDGCAAGPRTVAAFHAWLSALTGQERVTTMYCDAELRAQSDTLECWLSPWVPLTLTTTAGMSTQAAQDHATAEAARSRRAGPWPRDLLVRRGERQAAVSALDKIGLCLSGAPNPGDFELLLTVAPDGRGLDLVVDEAIFSREAIGAMANDLARWLAAFDKASGAVALIPLAPLDALRMAGACAANVSDADSSVHQAVIAQAALTPDREAISCQGRAMAYRELDEQSAVLAKRLLEHGVGPGAIVGVCLERTPDLVVAVLGIMRTGAAYLPLDPDYPRERIAFMVRDSATQVIVTDTAIATALGIPGNTALLVDEPFSIPANPSALPAVRPDSAAYVIYTSGSTGRPKGVVVTHRNVMNFFAGMDPLIPHDPPGRWLAVTSLSFDISVLELCWTLARGFTVVLHSNAVKAQQPGPEFSLFYFASDNSSASTDRYQLLLEGAKFADTHGFHAIWTPERHFHAFGGLYPNPALTSAAIAAMTTRLKIRAGSCVLPLHHPIRVAEDWAFVDNISQGRVGVSFASGWQPNDFVIAPSAYANRKNDMLANIDLVRRLWRGESVAFTGPLGAPVDVTTRPRPVQKELPVWVTAAGNPETFRQAGELGCHLLTHLLGQDVADVAGKLEVYRSAWRQASHAGNGHVTLMLHTFVGQDEDQVRETIRGPMKEYLRSSVDLIKQAAWSFPALVERAAQDGKSPAEVMESQPLSAQDMDALLEHAFSRYYGSSALFGTPRRCLDMVARLRSAGVDEIACLIDFGVETDTVLAHLHDLKGLMDASRHYPATVGHASVAQEIARNGITHLQCTPSMAAMLVADAAGRAALARLSVLIVGGEALAPELARRLRALVPGALFNMYGPTETTVWSTACAVAGAGDFVPLGQPIINTRLAVQTPWGMDCPAWVPGELLIGGDGVAQGYLNRPDLTAERFIADPAEPGTRFYRTGDLVRRHPSGALEFLGRMDHQVKVRGHRIELGEIESVLMAQNGVAQAVVVAREEGTAGKRLAAYVTAKAGSTVEATQLRAALGQVLPEAMLPATVSVLPALPLTPNGKIDRRALPEAVSAPVVRPASGPRSQLETTIAGIWEEVLGLSGVGTTDNFFDLGGHSLQVVRVQMRLREICGREVSVADMFRLPTIRALAAHLDGHAAPAAVGEGLTRANARRLMRSRSGTQPARTPAA